MTALSSCALLGLLFEPDLEEEKQDHFERSTGHQLLKIGEKEPKLGYIYEDGTFTKKVWGGKEVMSQLNYSTKLIYTKEDLDQIKLFLGDDFELGPHLKNIHHIYVNLDDIHRYQLTDLQPMIEYMGKEDRPLLEEDFVVSMIKVTRFSVEAYQEVEGAFGAEYRHYELPFKISGSTGSTSTRTEEQVGYNIFIGYKLYNGSRWIKDFEATPKVDIWILHPNDDAVIDQVRGRVKGSILNYHKLEEDYRTQLRLYLMVRDHYYDDDWVLQSKVSIDTLGRFEGLVHLGTLKKGDGHRYSIAVFATYFDINREVNSRFPFLPFNKGQYIIYVTRRDEVK